MSQLERTLSTGVGAAWVEQVHRLMTDVGIEYPDASPERQRELAGVVVAQLCAAIADLGIFEGDASPAQDGLINLLMMIRDLESGRRHLWAAPVSVGGTSWERQVEREIRLWAITAVRLQQDAGLAVVASYRAVAADLSAAGYRAKENGVKTWCTRHARSPRNGDEARIAETLDSFKKADDPAIRARAFVVETQQVLSDLIGRFQP
jgi:hypothetical protein